MMRCQWLPQGSGPDPAVAAISGTITRGVQAASNITGKMPSTSGAFSLQCFLVSGSNIVGGALAAVLLSSPGTNYDARIESIGLPATMPYGLNGNSASPVRFNVTVSNKGTTAWTPGQVSAPQLHFSWSRDPDHASMPVTTTVAPGSAVDFEGVYQCESPGSSELVVQMRAQPPSARRERRHRDALVSRGPWTIRTSFLRLSRVYYTVHHADTKMGDGFSGGGLCRGARADRS
jgi:hypothetical protein